MKRLLTVLGALATTAAISAPVYAQPALTLGDPTYGGSGCPNGTARAVLSPDRTTLSILYDQWISQSTGGFDRKNCDLAIPLNVPQGLSVSIVAIDYRGFNFLPAGATSQFRVEYFFAGGTGPVFTRNFSGPLLDEFIIHNALGVAAIVWSACGQDVILRTNASTFVLAPAGQQSMISVDSEDIQASVIFAIQWRTC